MIKEINSPNHLSSVLSIFEASILAIDESLYSKAEKEAWICSIKNKEKWLRRLKEQYFVGIEIDEIIRGFASIDTNNYLDLLFVHPDYQRMGLATKLYDNLEAWANKNTHEINYIETHASKISKPFFESKGFELLTENEVQIGNQKLKNFIMRKPL